MLDKIRKLLSHTCIFFTVFVTAMYTFGMLSGSTSWVPTLKVVYFLLLFSLLFSCLNAFLVSDALVYVMRLIIHFLGTGVLFFTLFAVGGGYITNGGSAIIAIVCYILIYAFCALCVFIYHYIFGGEKVKSAKQKKEEKYVSQFPKKPQ